MTKHEVEMIWFKLYELYEIVHNPLRRAFALGHDS